MAEIAEVQQELRQPDPALSLLGPAAAFRRSTYVWRDRFTFAIELNRLGPD